MRFKSGMLGVCIVVIALLGTVASGFLLNVEKDQREVTKFDYITDVTGLFDIQDTPEYVDYNPNANYVGYTPSSAIDFTPTSKVNNYRYVTAEGTTYNTTYTITPAKSYAYNSSKFQPAEVGSSGFINWTGTYDFGSTVTNHGVTYNTSTASVSVQVGELLGSAPMITSLATVFNDMGLGAYQSATMTITYGSMPVMFYHGNWTFTDVDREDGYSQYIYSAEMNNDNTMPDKFEVNLSTLTVKAYRNDVLLYNDNASNVDVIWRYSTRAGGSFSPADDTSATISITAITYPTYGYMDPTKGISMDSTGTGWNTAIGWYDEYTPMEGLFTTPDIPYPDTPTTDSFNWGSNQSSPNTLGLMDTSFWNGDTRTINLQVKWAGQSSWTTATATNTATFKANPDVTSFGAWLDYILTWRQSSTTADYSAIDIDLTIPSGSYPVFIIPKTALTIISNSANYLTYLYNASLSQTPDRLEIDCSTGLVIAFRENTQLWTADSSDIILVYKLQENTTLNTTFGLTLYGFPDTETGPSYPILYINKTDGYGWFEEYLTINGQNVNTAVHFDTGTNTLSLTSLATIMAEWTFYGSDIYYIDFVHTDYPVYMSPTAVWTYLTVGDYTQPYAKYYYTAGTGAPFTVIDRMVYDTTAGTVEAYTGDDLRWTADPEDVWVAYQYHLLDGSSDNPAVYQQGYASVDTAVTVTPLIGGSATWSNGYQNDTINITVQRYDLNGNDLTITAGASHVTLNIDASGKITVNDGVTNLNIGKWKGVQLTISASEGYLAVTPSNSLSFTSTIPLNGTTQYINDWYNGGTISELEFSTSNQSPYWQIAGTSVFLDTFNTVMNNPSINIEEYFPDYDEWRLNFYSFALYGDSVTINNVPMSVDRERGTVSFTINDRTYTKPLNNIYVTKSEVGGASHTQLTFVNDKATYDLGETVSDVISFTGLWYFTTGLYEAYTGTESYYDWTLDGAWHNTSAQTMVIFLGLILFGCLGAKGLFRFSIKSLDGVVVIFSALIILFYFGGSA